MSRCVGVRRVKRDLRWKLWLVESEKLLAIGWTKLLLHRFTRCFREICCLNIFLYSNKWFFKSVKWAWIQHLLLDLRKKNQWIEIKITTINILTFAVSGHQDIKKSFCFLVLSDVPWHWCIYSKSKRPYRHSPALDEENVLCSSINLY